MSRENLYGVDVTRVQKGVYVIDGWLVEDVKGTTGWRMTKGRHVKWRPTLRECEEFLSNLPPEIAERCAYCGNPIDLSPIADRDVTCTGVQELQPDPYNEEINNDPTPVMLCPGEWWERKQDI